MWPIGPLMHEHRLIERMIERLAAEAARLRAGGALDPTRIDQGVDFIRTYADRCHHGKEEDILFRDLASRGLSPELGRVMQELIQEHVHARGLVAKLAAANQGGRGGEAGAGLAVAGLLEELAAFYPPHILKEDKHFFFPCMELFSSEEKDAMLAEFAAFDQKLIHEKYGRVVAAWEERA
ncbi:MAG: hemerythrin domain-containing protein [Pseudomonadota bacterium]